jgi:hypothetical protein
MPEAATATRIIDLDLWEGRLPKLMDTYRNGKPFPFIILDALLDPASALQAFQAFPPVQDKGWIHYVHVNARKHGLNKMDRIPPYLGAVIQKFNSDRFVRFLEKLTGIQGLHADETLDGGGLQLSQRGGFLNIHSDLNVHPHKRTWKRRVVVLLYMNKTWDTAWGGDLELWERDMSTCVQKITPVFNRCVVFTTDQDSFHGVPDPIMCPENETRKSIALHYYTVEEKAPRMRTTNYRARPTDGAKALAIRFDNQALAGYTRMKRLFGMNDDLISKVLNLLGGKRK